MNAPGSYRPVLLGRGGTGTIYKLSPFLAVKRARKGQEEDHANEQNVFRMLARVPRIPHVIQCVHIENGDTFLILAENGSLAGLLSQIQQRNSSNGVQVLGVSQPLSGEKIRRWMQQLCCAAAGFERVGWVHGDIRPENILFNRNWDLVLHDFDQSVRIGHDLTAVSEPFGRLLSKEDGADCGTYGKAGPRTEMFAIGSVYYTLLRGYEPFQTEYWGRDHYVVMSEKLQSKEYPPLTDSAEDAIVKKCWYGEYQSLEELSMAFGTDMCDFSCVDAGWLEARKAECLQIIKSDFLKGLERH